MADKKSSEIEKEISQLINLFPKKVSVQVGRTDGGFWADIRTFPGLITEADSFSELMEMVNDAVRTYFEVPEKYLPFMPDYKPPIAQANGGCNE